LPAGVPIAYTPPLWDSSTLQSMFVVRANANLGSIPKDRTAVLLVGHGQPDAWDVLWPTETEHELEFRRRVLRLFEQDGYRSDLLGIAWMEFKEPHPAPLVESLVAAGAEQVLFFSAAISAESLHSQYDVPALVGKARVPAGTRLVNLGAWNDDPLVIAAIRERVDAALATVTAHDEPAKTTTQGAVLPSG
jgi:sirohydrochlorin ferrochelatase